MREDKEAETLHGPVRYEKLSGGQEFVSKLGDRVEADLPNNLGYALVVTELGEKQPTIWVSSNMHPDHMTELLGIASGVARKET